MILASLQRLVALMGAGGIEAAPILATGSLNPGSEPVARTSEIPVGDLETNQ